MNKRTQDIEMVKEQIIELLSYKTEILKSFREDEYNKYYEFYEALDYDGSLHILIEGNIDVYYHSLRKWAVDHYDYIDNAIEEGVPELIDFHKLIQLGQFMYFKELVNFVIEEIYDNPECLDEVLPC